MLKIVSIKTNNKQNKELINTMIIGDLFLIMEVLTKVKSMEKVY